MGTVLLCATHHVPVNPISSVARLYSVLASATWAFRREGSRAHQELYGKDWPVACGDTLEACCDCFNQGSHTCAGCMYCS